MKTNFILPIKNSPTGAFPKPLQLGGLMSFLPRDFWKSLSMVGLTTGTKRNSGWPEAGLIGSREIPQSELDPRMSKEGIRERESGLLKIGNCTLTRWTGTHTHAMGIQTKDTHADDGDPVFNHFGKTDYKNMALLGFGLFKG
jgi:hypothetical protein